MEAVERAKALTPGERDQLAAKALQAKAHRALRDPVAFFELVLKDETTQKPIRVAPHQRVLLSFILHPAHDKVVIILPVGTGKTSVVAGLGLWFLARNPRIRGGIFSATQQQAKKPLIAIRQTIESSAELRLIAPQLAPTRRTGEPWSDAAITVDRPYGIRDPSFAAYGIESEAVMGSRIEFAIVDDLLNRENTETPEMRQKTHDRFFGQVANRIEPTPQARLVILNTTWHPQDYVNRLSEHWPTLRMSVMGDIYVSNADERWDCEELTLLSRTGNREHCRLAEHQPDPKRARVLWQERYSVEEIERQRLKYVHSPGDFARFFLSDAEDDSTALCKREFIVRCKHMAQTEGIHTLVPSYGGDWPTFTGVDLAVTPDKKGGATAYFTFAIRPGQPNKPEAYIILDIEIGHFDAMTIVSKLFEKLANYRSYAAVENNGTQELLIQVARAMGRDLPIRSHNTTQHGKAHVHHGVVGVFFELATGRWRIPTQKDAVVTVQSEVGLGVQEPVRQFLESCTSYKPERHTADVLMANSVARALAISLGYMNVEVER
jgi:hypothetical protein